MTNSWIASTHAPETVALRDDGAPGEDAVLDADGTELTPAVEPREAWPEGHEVHVKSRITGSDWNLVQKLQMSTRFVAEAAKPEEARMEGEMDILFQPLIYAAVLVSHFKGELFTDPDTGKLLEMPRDIKGRIATAGRLPVQVLVYVQGEINRLIADPLVKKPSESAMKEGFEPTPIRKSRASNQTK